MKEFGSDFHYTDRFQSNRACLLDVFQDSILLADGRQCIASLIRQYAWKRIWIPEYFCYEVLETIVNQTGIELAFYEDWPGQDDCSVVESLPYRKDDVLFRINYFGIRDFRSNNKIPIPVIEDHTHDLLGHWALYSDADWCIASLRKSLPLPEGGMMWSPKGHIFQEKIGYTKENSDISKIRWEAMHQKYNYLYDGGDAVVEKKVFRKKFVDTESWFDKAELSLIDQQSRDYLLKFDINAWQNAKRNNWLALKSLVDIETLITEDESCTPFSFIMLAATPQSRNSIRNKLIERSVFPAILWHLPAHKTKLAEDYSQRMLSIHCDGRYSEQDVFQLASIINEAINT